jgi:glycine dehydrogenase subunit 1
VAETSIQNAHYARARLVESGVELLFPDAPIAREFAVKTKDPSWKVIERGVAEGILAGVSLQRFASLEVDDGLLIAFTEKRNRAEIDRLVGILS